MSIRDSSLMLHHSSTANHLRRQQGDTHISSFRDLQPAGHQTLDRVTSAPLTTAYETGEDQVTTCSSLQINPGLLTSLDTQALKPTTKPSVVCDV